MDVYELTAKQVNDLTVYGVSIRTQEKSLCEYPFISCDRAEALRLLERLRDGNVSAVHYDDIVADYLLELAYARQSANGVG